MTDEEKRARVLEMARTMKINRVRYVNPAPKLNWSHVHGVLPMQVDCSRFVEYAVMRPFPDSPEGLLSPERHFTSARNMRETLDAIDQPEAGDLAVYVGATDPDEHHVMMVTDSGGVIGACPTFGCVDERESIDYAPERWRFRDYCRLPLQHIRGD